MSTWEDPDELLVCPYDPVHRVQRKRFQYHLIKCRKNFHKKDFKQCPFNARHVVPVSNFDYHLQICDDRGRFEAEQLKAQTERDAYLKGNTNIPVFDPSWQPSAEVEESWDDDNVVFVPASNSSNSTVGRGNPPPPPREHQRQPLPPQQRRPHPPGLSAAGKELREPLQPRPPKLETQTASQVFRHSLQTQTQLAGRGLGRGRGHRLNPGMVVVGQSMQGEAAVPASAIFELPELQEERAKELYKRQRKLQKMLRQIEHLEKRNETLTEEEFAKVGKKQLVLDQLQQLKDLNFQSADVSN